jgi:hypothetical protein
MTEITRDERSDNVAEHGAVMRGAVIAWLASQDGDCGMRIILQFLLPRGFMPTAEDVAKAVEVAPADPGMAFVDAEFESIRQFRADANARKAANGAPPRLCKDCRHATWDPRLPVGHPNCGHPKARISLVSGEPDVPCAMNRGPHHATEWTCGPSAVGFEAKS